MTANNSSHNRLTSKVKVISITRLTDKNLIHCQTDDYHNPIKFDGSIIVSVSKQELLEKIQLGAEYDLELKIINKSK